MAGFWNSWMTVWCWSMVAISLLFVGAAHPATDAGALLFNDIINGDRPVAGLFDDPGMRFAQGLIGAIFLGWALTIVALVRMTGGAPIWRALTGAVLVWYVTDSAISVGTGFWINAVTNTAFLATYLAPVLGSGVLRDGRRAALA